MADGPVNPAVPASLLENGRLYIRELPRRGSQDRFVPFESAADGTLGELVEATGPGEWIGDGRMIVLRLKKHDNHGAPVLPAGGQFGRAP
jgi:hypothetical protein